MCPTLMREVSTFVYGETPDFFSDPFFLRSADPKVVEELRDPKRRGSDADQPRGARSIESARRRSRGAEAPRRRGGADCIRHRHRPAGEISRAARHRELELMVTRRARRRRGRRASTSDAAACLQTPGLGMLPKLARQPTPRPRGNPFDDIPSTHSLESVWIAGQRVPR